MPENPHRETMGRMARRKKLTKTQRLYFERLLMRLEQIRDESKMDYHVQALVPEAWDTLERDVDVDEKKVRITLRLDESVARFYRAMGTGYQARINRILATFAQMRIAQIRRLDEMDDEEMRLIASLRE